MGGGGGGRKAEKAAHLPLPRTCGTLGLNPLHTLAELTAS